MKHFWRENWSVILVIAVMIFVLLDGTGEVVLQQIGMPEREAIKEAIAELLK